MKKSIFSVVVALAILCGNRSFGDTPQFEKVSDHCYYLQLEESEATVAVVVSEEGILMVDPPQEQSLPRPRETKKGQSLHMETKHSGGKSRKIRPWMKDAAGARNGKPPQDQLQMGVFRQPSRSPFPL